MIDDSLSLFNSLSSLVFITSLYSLSVPSFYVGVSILVCLYSQLLDPLINTPLVISSSLTSLNTIF